MRRTFGITPRDFVVDLVIFLAFLAATDPRFTGLPIHEWLGIAFGAAILLHLLLHWKWIATVVRRFFSRLPGQVRINSLLNVLLFIDIVLVVVTGVFISRVVLATLGLEASRNMFWRWLHALTSDLGVIIVGLHVALHWKWIVSTIKRYVIQPLTGAGRRAQPHAVRVNEQERPS